jgi:hypothetical protein
MRKGQAALEFITTYGWAFLVILVLIGAITYFGILKPDTLLPSRCTVAPEFSCDDYKNSATCAAGACAPNAGNTSILLRQSLGKTIFDVSMNCTYQGNTYQAIPYVLPSPPPTNSISSWSPQRQYGFECWPLGLPDFIGRKQKISFAITYTKSPGGLNHTAEGEVYTEVR